MGVRSRSLASFASVNSISNLSEDINVPLFTTEDQDWQAFSYLLDSCPEALALASIPKAHSCIELDNSDMENNATTPSMFSIGPPSSKSLSSPVSPNRSSSTLILSTGMDYPPVSPPYENNDSKATSCGLFTVSTLSLDEDNTLEGSVLLPHFESEEEDWKQFAYLLDQKETLLKFDEEREKDGILDDEASQEEEHLNTFPVSRLEPSPQKLSSVGLERLFPNDPAAISLGSPSQLQPQGDLSEVKKEEPAEDSLSIAERVHRKRASDSESSSRTGAPPAKRSKMEKKEEGTPSLDAPKASCCGTEINFNRTLLNCTVCSRLFHPKCVGLTEKKAKRVDRSGSWKCKECKEEKSLLYCVCRTVYDDTKFYVGCDDCEGWYHPSCVGITQQEAETAASYICPPCQEASSSQEPPSSAAHSIRLSSANYSILSWLVGSLEDHHLSWPFRKAINTRNHAKYFNIVKEPMDLDTMRRKVHGMQYGTLGDFAADFALLIQNGRTVHAKDAVVTDAAREFEEFYKEREREALEKLMPSRDRKESESQRIDSSLDMIDTDQLFKANVDDSTMKDLCSDIVQ